MLPQQGNVMITSGITHTLAVLVSILTAGSFYEQASRHFPELDGVITQWVLPVLGKLDIPMPVHTAGLLITAMMVGFVVGMAFRPLRRA